MESLFPLQENLGSMVLLTNKTTISNKLLTLASPRPRNTWICRHMRVTIPSIGTIWYLPACWLFHIYLEITCIRELDLLRHSLLISVVQVLLAISVVLMALFTASTMLKVGQPSVDLNSVCTYQKRPSLKHIVQAIRSQKYPLQALAAFILMNSYLLLQLSQLSLDHMDKTSGNDTVSARWSRLEANSSKAEDEVALPLPAEKFIPYLAFCVNFAIPLIIYSMQESEPVWQMESLWGFFYSVILLLLTLKYPSASLTFYVISLRAHQSPQSLLFQGVSTWLPALYVISALSLFSYSLSLKIYIELSFKTLGSDSPATNLTVRRKIRLYPSPLGVVLTTILVVGSEIPLLLHLIHFLLLDTSEIFMVYLLVFNTGFCLLCFCGCVIIGFRRSCRTNKSRVKQKRIDSGVCLANSFVYQSSPETTKAKC